MIIKLNSICDRLDAIAEQIETKCDQLDDKMQAIQDKADEHDRDLTETEQKRFDDIEGDIMELKEELDAINDALDYLRDFTE